MDDSHGVSHGGCPLLVRYKISAPPVCAPLTSFALLLYGLVPLSFLSAAGRLLLSQFTFYLYNTQSQTMSLSMLAVSASLASIALAEVIPTAPGPNEVFRAGSNCTIQWNSDTSGAWNNMTIGTLET